MRRILQSIGILAIGCGFCFASGYSARGAEPQTGPQESSKATDPGVLFDRLDTSHAGVLSADKIPADKRSLFERLLRLAGKPADGQLTRAEFVAQLKSITEPPASDAASSSSSGSSGSTSKSPASGTAKPAASDGKKLPNPSKAFDRLDKNHTGKLTLSDIPEERQKFFKRLLREAGKPAGGSLTKDEFVKAFEAVLAKRPNSPAEKPTESKTNQPPAAGRAFDVDTMVARLMKLSTRPDGKLTKSDLPERMQSRFDKIDTNQDGLVDETELRAWLTKVKRQLAAAAALTGASASPAAAKDTTKSDAAK